MKNKRNIMNYTLLIIWMIVIFIMSNQPASISDSQSGGILKGLAAMGINMDSIFGDFANFVIRKTAHFFEYMILALFVFNAFQLTFNTKKLLIMTIVFVFIYACTDEIHQLFVSGREGTIRDVIIDTCGGAAFLLLKVKNQVNLS